ncbi:MAG: hypothetical protein KGO96_04740 [Elusimicrobia bacterium]|nr:hypothetical protein [Elusimicrobiota bacterium]
MRRKRRRDFCLLELIKAGPIAALSFVLLAPALAASSEPPDVARLVKQQAARALKDEKRAQLEEAQARKRAFQDQQKLLSSLKKIDPAGYARAEASLKRQERIEDIRERFRAGKLPLKMARSSLLPLVAAELKPELTALPERIAKLRKELQFLEKAQKNPKLLARRRVDELLGQAQANAGLAPPLPQPPALPPPPAPPHAE